ncbi:MAG: aldose epimerase [Pseudonocardiaceae bacterium]|nr:aldose epimerase [Pseudonocardiaceae bacterium]
MIPPSGQQYELHCDDQHVVVTEVGGGLRHYSIGQRAVLDGYGRDEMATGARGQTLIPWPNRIADGRYRFADAQHTLALTEPEAHNAIHGLVRWANWELVEHGERQLRLHHRLHAQTGWPHVLDCELDYRLEPDGLTVRTTATNAGALPCPYAAGAHPYLAAGAAHIDAAQLRVPGRRYYPTDERGIPAGREPVDGTRYDLREPVELGDRAIDVAYTDLVRDPDGLARVSLTAPDGGSVALWVSEAYPYLEIFTGDTLPEPGRRRRGLGVEPMTAAPNAFQTGDGLVTLQPGQAHTAEWGIEPGRS